MRSRALVAMLSLGLTGAAPAAMPAEIPWGTDSDEALIVPANSPVQFIRYDESRIAHFHGRFVLTGTFVYGCDIECDPPLTKGEVTSSIIPDRVFADRLPHWKIRNTDMRIVLDGGDRLAALVISRSERASIYAGKVDDIRKRVSIVVDDFNTTLECDSPSFGARFVSLAEPARIATAKLDGDYGCGWI